MRVVCLCILSTLLLLLPSAARPVTKASHKPAAPHVELSNSFIITSYQDLEPQNIHGHLIAPCEYSVARARSIGGKHFSIVNTAYWIGGAGHVDYFAFKDVSKKHPQGFAYDRVGVGDITRWKRGLKRCITAAVHAGFTGLQILNHIDQGATPAAWRNMLNFDPVVKYGGFTYEDVVVRPIADALRTSAKSATRIWFMISGECGRSVFSHPKSYMHLISKYRGTLRRGRDPRKVKVGVALNWDKVCGDCFYLPYTTTPEQYNATYRGAWGASKWYILRNFQISDIQRLFAVCDVIGISAYAPSSLAVSPESFALPFDTAAYELHFWGIFLEKLVMRQGKEFIFSEVGLGGAAPDQNSIANDLSTLASWAANGIWNTYNRRQDPWRRADFRDYRRKWFFNLLSFLQRGGSSRGRISAAFLWSVGSYDVAAIHPISVSIEGSYADPEIVGWLRRASALSP